MNALSIVEDGTNLLIRTEIAGVVDKYFKLFKEDVCQLFDIFVEYLHNEGEIKFEEEVIKVTKEEWEAMLKKEEQEEEQEEEINVQNLDGFLKDLQESFKAYD